MFEFQIQQRYKFHQHLQFPPILLPPFTTQATRVAASTNLLPHIAQNIDSWSVGRPAKSVPRVINLQTRYLIKVLDEWQQNFWFSCHSLFTASFRQHVSSVSAASAIVFKMAVKQKFYEILEMLSISNQDMCTVPHNILAYIISWWYLGGIIVGLLSRLFLMRKFLQLCTHNQ